MANRRQKGSGRDSSKGTGNLHRRKRQTLQESLKCARARAHDRANRRIAPPGQRKSIQAAIRASQPIPYHEEYESTRILTRALRWAVGLALLPFVWVTAWTFLARLGHATIHQEFWKTTEFWYFSIGSILATSWLLSGFFRNYFLFLYVLGHEFTHVIFVWFHLGKVSNFHVSTHGGYITTNKTNLLIALSPYFIPVYSILVLALHSFLRFFEFISDVWNPIFFTLIGASWMFHMIWTLWMLPKDQPDLQEHGRFLSLIIILLGNILVLSSLICIANPNPMAAALEFSREWFRIAAVSGDSVFRASILWIEIIRQHLGR